MKYQATVKKTGENLIVYSLKDGNFYDFENLSEALPPSAPKSGKKEFTKDEIIIKEQIK